MERIVGVLNDYDNPIYYENATTKIFDEIIQIINDILTQLIKKKKIVAIDSIVIEITGKLLYFAICLIDEMVVHSDFKCSASQQIAWLNGLKDFIGKLDVLYQTSLLITPVSQNVFIRCTHQPLIESKIEKISNNFFDTLLLDFENNIKMELKCLEFNSMNLHDIFLALTNKTNDRNNLKENVLKVLEKRQLNKFIYCLLLSFLDIDLTTIQSNIEKISRELVLCIDHIDHTDINNEITFVEQLKIFFKQTNRLKLEVALSCIKELLIFKPSRQELIRLVSMRFDDNKKLKKHFTGLLNEHYTGSKRIIETQDRRKLATRKFRIFMTVVLFCIKVKINKQLVSMNKRKTCSLHHNNTNELIDVPIDYSKLYKIVRLKISYQLISQHCLKTLFKNHSVFEM